MIVDCCLFFNETDLLDVRLHELAPVVDYFVIVEASITHSGNAKPLHLFEQRARLLPFADKIRYVPVEDVPQHATPTSRENIQRAMIGRGLQGLHLSNTDWILISDLDEIPRADVVRELSTQTSVGFFMLEQQLSYYYMNIVTNQPWHGTRMVRKDHFVTAQAARIAHGVPVPQAGWHWSYLGGAQAIQDKISAFLHQEHNTTDTNSLAHIQETITKHRDLYNRPDITFTKQPLDATYPAYVQAHPDLFAHWIAPE